MRKIQPTLAVVGLQLCRRLFALALLVGTLATSREALAKMCTPISQRTGELGCWITANAAVAQLPDERSRLSRDTYPTRVEAQAAKGPRGTVVKSLGKV